MDQKEEVKKDRLASREIMNLGHGLWQTKAPHDADELMQCQTLRYDT